MKLREIELLRCGLFTTSPTRKLKPIARAFASYVQTSTTDTSFQLPSALATSSHRGFQSPSPSPTALTYYLARRRLQGLRSGFAPLPPPKIPARVHTAGQEEVFTTCFSENDPNTQCPPLPSQSRTFCDACVVAIAAILDSLSAADLCLPWRNGVFRRSPPGDDPDFHRLRGQGTKRINKRLPARFVLVIR